MIQNVGNAERAVRVLSGVAVGAAGVYYQSWFGLIGLVPAATGFLGYCVVYRWLGVNTCQAKPLQ